MEHIHLKATQCTPLVIFTPEDHTLKVEGKMIPENIEDVMGPIGKWLDEYMSKHNELHVLFRLYYYNTSSSRQFFLLCKKLDDYFQNGRKISVRWDYEEGDEESRSDAEEFLGAVSFPHEIVEVTE
jgi:hypothetical protein